MFNTQIQNKLLLASLLCFMGCQEEESEKNTDQSNTPSQTDEPLAEFNELNEEGITSVLESATGIPGMTLSFVSMGALEDSKAGGCPQMIEQGDNILLKGNGCSTPAGIIYNGTLQLTTDCDLNFENYDGDVYCEMTAESFSMEQGGFSFSFDGWFVDESIDYEHVKTSMDLSLSTIMGDVSKTVRSTLDFTYSTNGDESTVRYAEGEGSVDGIGKFSVDSQWEWIVTDDDNVSVNYPDNATIEVDGEDSLSFVLVKETGCYNYTSDSKEGEICY